MTFPKVTETDVMEIVDQVLAAHHIPHHRNNVGCTKIGRRFIRFGWPGSADFIGIIPSGPLEGHFLGVECKAPKTGRLSEGQRNWLDMVNRHGGVAIVVDSLGSLENQLKEREVI